MTADAAPLNNSGLSLSITVIANLLSPFDDKELILQILMSINLFPSETSFSSDKVLVIFSSVS